MKRIRKIFFLLFLALFWGMGTAFAYDFSLVCETGQTLYYNIVDPYNEYVEIVAPAYGNSNPWTGFTRPTGPITLPSSVYYNETNYTVVAIGDEAFGNCSGLTGSLTIPNTVATIGYGSFWGCSGLDGVLTIPSSVVSIGQIAFGSCGHFTQIIYNAANCRDLSSGDLPFSSAICPLIIGDAVQRIPAYLFNNCAGISGSLIIPDNVTAIGAGAFRKCSGLSELTLDDGVVSIDYLAFSECTGLSQITAFPETPPTLGLYVFTEVPSATPVIVPCSAWSAYQSAPGWSDFSNMTCANVYKVTVSAMPAEGGTVTGGGSHVVGTECTVTATPNDDWHNYQFLHWNKDGEVVSCSASYTFAGTEDVHLEAVFMRTQGVGTVVGNGGSTNVNLPSNSTQSYTLSQQIYTPAELGSAQSITSISFFNEGSEATRDYDIYLVHTDQTTFASASDWISVTTTDKVFSGSVTMRKGVWTTIVLDRSFYYNGSSNLALIVDDNTGSYTPVESGMACRTIPVSVSQSIYTKNFYNNYDPLNPPTSGTRYAGKNQLILNRPVFNIAATASDASMGTVSGAGQYGYRDVCHLKAIPNPGYIFMDWTDNSGNVVSTDEIYSFVVENNKTLTANFVPDGDYCSLVFDLHDSWGDGWGNNYLKLDLENGMTRKLAVPSNGHDVTYTLPIENGSHVKLSWNKAVYYNECSFEVRYSNGNLVCTSDVYDLNTYFEYEFYMDCDEMSPLMVYVGDHGENTDQYLPSYTYYCYNLSEQIYTADEIGTAGNIGSIAFYNQGTTSVTRNYDIFLKATTKTAFDSSTDFISVTEEDKVFSGNVTFTPEAWVTITFDTPFAYDGSSNVVLVMDDNSNDYTTGGNHVFCRVFDAAGYQTLRLCNDYTNFDPYNPSYDGGWVNVKNQVFFGFTNSPTSVTQTLTLSSGWNWVSLYVAIDDPEEALQVLEERLGDNGLMIKSKGDFTMCYDGEWGVMGDLEEIDNGQMYMIQVANDCTVELQGAPVNPEDYAITIMEGWNWIVFPSAVTTGIEEAFINFEPEDGDQIKGKGDFSMYYDGEWGAMGDLEVLTAGEGFMYFSNSATPKTLTFVFPASK